jgi:hypothetical protein
VIIRGQGVLHEGRQQVGGGLVLEAHGPVQRGAAVSRLQRWVGPARQKLTHLKHRESF